MSETTPKKPAAKKAKPARKRTSRAKAKTAPADKAAAAAPPVEPAAPPEASDALFRIDFEVRWRDLDAFNHVNNSTFLTYLEEARLRWLESLDGPWLTETSAPVLASAELQFRRPIPWPETLSVTLHAERAGNSSLTLGHRISSATDPDAVYCEGRVVMVWVDAASGKGASLPEAVRRAAESRLGD
ncbi:acyl-CoA thioesterase [Pseudomarimonas salicorniae]|uniref:Acyl-CoA thioesterase n=1 Tax=Pseudomarimonas salicorniae TaxID=2933270 RepID=A0ABT0GGN1_9GAMM|nr:thioesterase family protein [Lysobacter sp. CAU 1642]MCK7593217.1 acyl-CoA thioesterase [Lysobacter sp. CAU 1642]